jgi:hypothetical protein
MGAVWCPLKVKQRCDDWRDLDPRCSRIEHSLNELMIVASVQDVTVTFVRILLIVLTELVIFFINFLSFVAQLNHLLIDIRVRLTFTLLFCLKFLIHIFLVPF